MATPLITQHRRDYPSDPATDQNLSIILVAKYGRDYVMATDPLLYQMYKEQKDLLLPTGDWDETKKGLGRSWEGLKGTAYGAVGLLGGASEKYLGIGEDLRDWGLEGAREKFAEASKEEYEASTDTDWSKDKSKYLSSLAGEALPSVGESLLAAGIGAGAGALAVPGPDPTDVVTVPGGFVAGLVGKSTIKKMIRDMGKEHLKDLPQDVAVRELRNEMGEEAFKEVAGKYVQNSYMTGGSWIANFLNSYGLNAGEIYGEITRDPNVDPDTAVNISLGFGGVSALPDSILPSLLVGKVVKSLNKTPLDDAGRKILFGTVSASPAGQATYTLATSVGTESATEFLQEFNKIVAVKAHGNMREGMGHREAIEVIRDAYAAPLSEQELSQMYHAAAVGAMAGGMTGGPVGAVQYFSDGKPADPTAPADPTTEVDPVDPPIDTVDPVDPTDPVDPLVGKVTPEEEAAIDRLVEYEIADTAKVDESGRVTGWDNVSDPDLFSTITDITSSSTDSAVQQLYYKKRQEARNAAVAAADAAAAENEAARGDEPETVKPEKVSEDEIPAEITERVKKAIDPFMVDQVLSEGGTITVTGIDTLDGEQQPAPIAGSTFGSPAENITPTPAENITPTPAPPEENPNEIKRPTQEATRAATQESVNAQIQELESNITTTEGRIKRYNEAFEELTPKQQESQAQAASEKLQPDVDNLRLWENQIAFLKGLASRNYTGAQELIGDTLAWHTQEQDKSSRGDNTTTYPAFYSSLDKAEDTLTNAERELAEANQRAVGAIAANESQDEINAALTVLGNIITSEARHKGSKADTSRMVVVKKVSVDQSANDANAVQLLPVHKFNQNTFKVSIPVGEERANKNNKFWSLEKLLKEGYDVVGSVRTAFPIRSGVTEANIQYSMSTSDYTRLARQLESRRASEASGAAPIAQVSTGTVITNQLEDEDAVMARITEEGGEGSALRIRDEQENEANALGEAVASSGPVTSVDEAIIERVLSELGEGTTPPPLPEAVKDWVNDTVGDLVERGARWEPGNVMLYLMGDSPDSLQGQGENSLVYKQAVEYQESHGLGKFLYAVAIEAGETNTTYENQKTQSPAEVEVLAGPTESDAGGRAGADEVAVGEGGQAQFETAYSLEPGQDVTEAILAQQGNARLPRDNNAPPTEINPATQSEVPTHATPDSPQAVEQNGERDNAINRAEKDQERQAIIAEEEARKAALQPKDIREGQVIKALNSFLERFPTLKRIVKLVRGGAPSTGSEFYALKDVEGAVKAEKQLDIDSKTTLLKFAATLDNMADLKGRAMLPGPVTEIDHVDQIAAGILGHDEGEIQFGEGGKAAVVTPQQPADLAVPADQLDVEHFFVDHEGGPLTMSDPVDFAQATDQAQDYYRMMRDDPERLKSQLEEHGLEVLGQRVRALEQIARYLRSESGWTQSAPTFTGQSLYTMPEAAMVLLFAAKYSFRPSTDGRGGKLVKMARDNRHPVMDMGPDTIARFVAHLRGVEVDGVKQAPKSGRKAIEAAFRESHEASLREIQASDRDGWHIFKQSEEMSDAEELAKACAGTSWCIGDVGTAHNYLSEGDHHAYYVNGWPEIMVRFHGDTIAEAPRGRAENQRMSDPRYDEIAESYITEKKFPGAEGFLEDLSFKKALTKLRKTGEWDKALSNKVLVNTLGPDGVIRAEVVQSAQWVGGVYGDPEIPSAVLSYLRGHPSRPEIALDGGVLEGNLLIKETSSSASIRGVVEVTGSVEIEGLGGVPKDLGSIELIGGDLNVAAFEVSREAYASDAVSAPNLRGVGGDLRSPDAKVDAPQLRQVNGDVFLGGTTAVVTPIRGAAENLRHASAEIAEKGWTFFNLPRLGFVGGHLNFGTHGSPVIYSLMKQVGGADPVAAFPALEEVRGNIHVVGADLPSLTKVGSDRIAAGAFSKLNALKEFNGTHFELTGGSTAKSLTTVSAREVMIEAPLEHNHSLKKGHQSVHESNGNLWYNPTPNLVTVEGPRRPGGSFEGGTFRANQIHFPKLKNIKQEDIIFAACSIPEEVVTSAVEPDGARIVNLNFKHTPSQPLIRADERFFSETSDYGGFYPEKPGSTNIYLSPVLSGERVPIRTKGGEPVREVNVQQVHHGTYRSGGHAGGEFEAGANKAELARNVRLVPPGRDVYELELGSVDLSGPDGAPIRAAIVILRDAGSDGPDGTSVIKGLSQVNEVRHIISAHPEIASRVFEGHKVYPALSFSLPDLRKVRTLLSGHAWHQLGVFRKDAERGYHTDLPGVARSRLVAENLTEITGYPEDNEYTPPSIITQRAKLPKLRKVRGDLFITGLEVDHNDEFARENLPNLEEIEFGEVVYNTPSLSRHVHERESLSGKVAFIPTTRHLHGDVSDYGQKIPDHVTGELAEEGSMARDSDGNWIARYVPDAKDGPEIQLNLDIITRDQVEQKIDHELGHHIFRDPQFREAFETLWNSLTPGTQLEIMHNVRRFYSDGVHEEESRVRALEKIHRLAVSNEETRTLWEQFVAAVRRIYQRLTGADPVKVFNVEELSKYMIAHAVASISAGETPLPSHNFSPPVVHYSMEESGPARKRTVLDQFESPEDGLSAIRDSVGETINTAVTWVADTTNSEKHGLISRLFLETPALQDIKVEVHEAPLTDEGVPFDMDNLKPDTAIPAAKYWDEAGRGQPPIIQIFPSEIASDEDLRKTILHEVSHALLHRTIWNWETRSGAEIPKHVVEELERLKLLRERAIRDINGAMDDPKAWKKIVGLEDVDEFVSEIMSGDNDLTVILSGMPGETRGESLLDTIMGVLRRIVQGILGAPATWAESKASKLGEVSTTALSEALESVMVISAYAAEARGGQESVRDQKVRSREEMWRAHLARRGGGVAPDPVTPAGPKLKTSRITTKPTISADEEIDNESSLKGNYASWSHVNEILEDMFSKWEMDGHNLENISFEKFVKKMVRLSRTPKSMQDLINAELIKQESTTLEGVAVKDLKNQERALRDAYDILLRAYSHLQRQRNLSEDRVKNGAERIDAANAEVQDLMNDYAAAKTLMSAVRKALLNSIKETGRGETGRKTGAARVYSEETEIGRELLNAENAVKDESNEEALMGVFQEIGKMGRSVEEGGEGLDLTKGTLKDLVELVYNNRTPELDAHLRSMRDDSGPAKQALVAILVQNGRANQYLFDLAALRTDSARGEVNNLISMAMSSDSAAIDNARAMIPRLTKNARAAERILLKLNRHKVARRKAVREMKQALEFIDFDNSTRRIISTAMSEIEGTLKIEQGPHSTSRQTSLWEGTEGAKYLVPSSPDQTSEDLSKSQPETFTLIPRSSRDGQSAKDYRNKLMLDLERMYLWLNQPGRQRDKTYNFVNRTYKVLSNEVATQEYEASRDSLILTFFGTIADDLKRTGSPAMANILSRLSKFVANGRRHTMVEPYSHDWVEAEAEAISAMGMGNEGGKKRFRDNVFNPILAYFEANQQLLEQEPSHEAAVRKAFIGAKAMLMSGSTEVDAAIRSNPEAWAKVEALIRKTGEVSNAIINQQEEMGLKILDQGGKIPYFRKAIGAEIFTVSRHISATISTVANKMGEEGAGWRKTYDKSQPDGSVEQRLGASSPTQVRSETAAQYEAGEVDALREEWKAKSSNEVWNVFIRPLVEKSGESVFLSAETIGEEGLQVMAARSDVVDAFAAAEDGDVIGFAEELYAITGGDINDTEAMSKYVGGVAGKLQETFNSLYSNIYQEADPTEIRDSGLNNRRVMLDARQAEGFPAEWVEYSTFEEQQVLSTMRVFAAHSAFGQHLQGLFKDISTARREFTEQLDMLNSMQSQGLTYEQMKEKAVERYGKAGYKVIKAAANNLDRLNKVETTIKALIQNEAGATPMEMGAAYEVLSAFTGVVVQSLKTAFIDTSSLFVMPFAKYGLNRTGFRESFKGFNVLRQIIGTMFQTVGRQTDLDGGWQTKLNELHLGDQDNMRGGITRLAAALAREVPGADSIDTSTIWGRVRKKSKSFFTKASRVLREILNTGIIGRGEMGHASRYATFKPQAIFTQMGQWMTASNTINTWKAYTKLVADAVAYLDSTPTAQIQNGFMFSASNLGMPEQAFEYMVENLREYGMSLETLAYEAKSKRMAGGRADVFSNDQLRLLALMAQAEITKETSPMARPGWVYGNSWGRYINPLVGWSIEKSADVRRNWKFNDEAGEFSYKLGMRSIAPYFPILGVSLAFVSIREWWEERWLRKKPNMLEFDSAKDASHNSMAALDRLNRAGAFGIVGDVANSYLNPVTGRKFEVENRIFFLSMITSMLEDTAYWWKSGTPMDYQNALRPLAQNLGGSGYMEAVQFLNNLTGSNNREAQVTKRLNAENWLRVTGRSMDPPLDVRKPIGMRGAPAAAKPHFKNMAIAALSNDNELWNESLENARRELRESGLPEKEVEEKIKEAVRYNHPGRKVFNILPTESEYAQMLDSIPAEYQAEVRAALELYNGYAARLGVGPYKGKATKSTKPKSRSTTRSSTRSLQDSIMRDIYRGVPGGRSGTSSDDLRKQIMRDVLRY